MLSRTVMRGGPAALLVVGALLSAGACDDAEPAGAGGTSSSSASSSSASSSSSSSSSGAIDSGADTGADAPSVPAVAPPVITTSPPAGPNQRFTTWPVGITITTATEGADLFFTLDGSSPTPMSERYKEPFEVSTDPTMIRALARKEGLADSFASFLVDFDCPPSSITPPSFAPTGGAYPNTFNATVTTLGESTTVCFTVDGPDPQCQSGVCNAGSSTYSSAPIPITKTATTVRAIACRKHPTPCPQTTPVVTQTYTLKSAAVVPTPAPGAGFPGPTNVALTTATTNGAIHYTTDGSTPTCTTGMTATNTANLTITPPTTVRAIVCRTDFEASAVSELVYSN